MNDTFTYLYTQNHRRVYFPYFRLLSVNFKRLEQLHIEYNDNTTQSWTYFKKGLLYPGNHSGNFGYLTKISLVGAIQLRKYITFDAEFSYVC